MTAADHANTVREAIGADTDAPDSEQREAAALASLDALAVTAASLKTCPYCACSYELPNGWLHDSCPGCKRAEAAEARVTELETALLAVADMDFGPEFAERIRALLATEHTQDTA